AQNSVSPRRRKRWRGGTGERRGSPRPRALRHHAMPLAIGSRHAYIALAFLTSSRLLGPAPKGAGGRTAWPFAGGVWIWSTHGGYRRTDSLDRAGGPCPRFRPRARQAVRWRG